MKQHHFILLLICVITTPVLKTSGIQLVRELKKNTITKPIAPAKETFNQKKPEIKPLRGIIKTESSTVTSKKQKSNKRVHFADELASPKKLTALLISNEFSRQYGQLMCKVFDFKSNYNNCSQNENILTYSNILEEFKKVLATFKKPESQTKLTTQLTYLNIFYTTAIKKSALSTK